MRIFYDRLSSALWVALVSLLLLLAIYVSVGRVLMANLAAYREPILQELNVRLPFTVEAQSMRGSWQSFSPYVVMRDLRVSFPEQDMPPLAFGEGRIRIDVLNTLRTGTLQVRRVELTALKLRGELDSDGRFELTGFSGGQGTGAAWLEEFLLNIEALKLTDNQLSLGLPDGERREFALDLLLERESSRRLLEARLQSTAGTRITLLGEGVGNPFTPEDFDGRFYARVVTSSLGAMRPMMPQDLPLRMDGEGEVQVWLDLEGGQPSLSAHLDARNLDLTGTSGDWHVPLDELALKAQVSQEKNRWTLVASDLAVARDAARFHLPSVQFEAWEDSVRLRFPELAVRNALELLNEMRVIPEDLRDILNELAPTGLLPALEVSVLDLAQPAQSWQVRANFEQLHVESYRGAPGVTGATGYVDLTPRGGRFIVDSEDIALAFPAIYREPLRFADLSGEFGLTWDSDAVRLRSDLVTAQGEEGTARALFGLSLPLSESAVGPEMDLMVGVQDFDAAYRRKYLPYTLPDSLLEWLDRSIVDGRVADGAFLYRGSLRSGQGAMRTVQLAFNVARAKLEYDRQWPAATLQDAIVLIDDTAISVWAGQVGIFDSGAEDVSVETVINDGGEPVLAVRAQVSGPAADGLRILNESALASLVGGTFGEWRATGELDTQLDLELVLKDGAQPRVDVQAKLRDVDLDIVPGNLPVTSVNGSFGYSTTTGFSGDDLRGELWGRAVTATIAQRHADGSNYTAGTSGLRVNFAGSAAAADVRQWLGLDFLALADGTAAVEGGILLLPGEPPLLEVSSDLVGVSLDLPDPWRKAPGEARTFALNLPLGKDGGPLGLALGQDLALDIQLGGAFGGALGINAPPGAVEEGVFRVTGEAPFIEADQWLGFVTDYLLPAAAADGDVPAMPAPVEPVAPAAAPRVVVEQLRTQILRVLGQTVEATTFSLDIGPDEWQVAVANDWLRGEGALARTGGQSRVTVDYLDLDRLPELLPAENQAPGAAAQDAAPGSTSPFELPDLDISLLNLHQGERRLGDLRFRLASAGDDIRLEAIGGELAGMRLVEDAGNRLDWRRGEAPQTALSVQLAFKNIGNTLDYFGYQRIVETRKGEITLNLDWPGGPTDIDLAAGEGELALNFGSGNFLAVPAGASGALRVVSILNLFDIVRRLSLTHMFESGIPFDSVKGSVLVADGRITVPSLSVKGGSSFKFSGVSDIAQRNLSGELVATLPLANNLPWIAALAANLPVAAGVFVVSKLFDKQMQRLSSGVYSIEGTWDEPQISFDRIFDDRSKGVPKKTQESGEPATGTPAEPGVAAQEPPGDPAQPGAAPPGEAAVEPQSPSP